MGILKDLIDQIEEEYGSGDVQPLSSLDEKETESPIPVVVASDRRVLAWSSYPPHIRVYAWALQTLRFMPVDDGARPEDLWACPYPLVVMMIPESYIMKLVSYVPLFRVKWNDNATLPELPQIGCPRLHHSSAFRQVLRVIVGCPDTVSLRMGKLSFNRVPVPALLVQEG